MKEDNKMSSFCKATSACKEAAFYFLEGFNWNVEDAISCFLRDQVPPPKKRDKRTRVNWLYPSRAPLRRRYSTSTTSVSESKYKMLQDEITITSAALATSLANSSRELHVSNDVSHGQNIVSISNPVNYEFEGEGSSVIATKICDFISIEIDMPCSDPDSDS